MAETPKTQDAKPNPAAAAASGAAAASTPAKPADDQAKAAKTKALQDKVNEAKKALDAAQAELDAATRSGDGRAEEAARAKVTALKSSWETATRALADHAKSVQKAGSDTGDWLKGLWDKFTGMFGGDDGKGFSWGKAVGGIGGVIAAWIIGGVFGEGSLISKVLFFALAIPFAMWGAKLGKDTIDGWMGNSAKEKDGTGQGLSRSVNGVSQAQQQTVELSPAGQQELHALAIKHGYDPSKVQLYQRRGERPGFSTVPFQYDPKDVPPNSIISVQNLCSNDPIQPGVDVYTKNSAGTFNHSCRRG